MDLGETAEVVSAKHFGSRTFEYVMIGGGLSAAPYLLLFEKLVNLINERAPAARMCFNTAPADTAEA